MFDQNSESLTRLYKAMLTLETEAECREFLADICTIKELLDMAQRLETATLLDRGENYQTISEKLGISTATISRVSRCLTYGDGGYHMVLDRLESLEAKAAQKQAEEAGGGSDDR